MIGDTVDPAVHQASLWDLEELRRLPEAQHEERLESGGVRAVFLDSVPWRGRPTKVFAYYGVPAHAAGETVPAMLLLHGGDGSAFASWVELWVSRGYAAIAVDTCGAIGLGNQNHPRHAWAGPPGWGGFDQIDEPLEDQWTYHAVAAGAVALTFISAQNGVDAGRVGATGISWGGYLASILAGVDDRLSFVAPVYGTGYLHLSSAWKNRIWQLGDRRGAIWSENWDPSRYLERASMPLLWVTGVNDFAFPLDALAASAARASGNSYFSIRARMEHDHGGPGERPREIQVMADALLRGIGETLPILKETPLDGSVVMAEWHSPRPVDSVALQYTTDSGPWAQRKWEIEDLAAESTSGTALGNLPEGAVAHFFSITDADGNVSSSCPTTRPLSQ